MLTKMPKDAKLAASSDAMSLFRPPIVRSASAALDRALFSKTIPVAAARVSNLKNLSKFRQQLDKSKELMQLERVMNVRPDPDPLLAEKGGKCLLLKPEIKPEGIFDIHSLFEEDMLTGRTDPSTWSPTLTEAVKGEDVGVIPYDLKLDYNYWTYRTYVSNRKM